MLVLLRREASRCPTVAARAYRLLRAFLGWAQDEYQVSRDAILTDRVRRAVPTVSEREGDALQREQLWPWFEAVQQIDEPSQRAFLQCLLLLGCRRGELLALQWEDVDFQWHTLTIRDKVEGQRPIPMPPYAASLLDGLPRRN